MSDTAAAPVPFASLAELVDAADLVVAGVVAEVVEAGTPVGALHAEADDGLDEAVRARFDVGRTLKGEAPGRIDVESLRGRAPGRPWTPLEAGRWLVAFLRGSGERRMPVDPRLAGLPTLPDVDAPATADPLSAVAAEFEQVVERADTVTQADVLVAAAAARAGLRRPVDLGVLGRPAFGDALRRGAWLTIALAAGQTEALTELGPLLGRSDPALAPLRPLVIPAISAQRDPAALPDLATLARSDDEAVAWAAASALRGISDGRASGELVALLDSPYMRVRYQAVMGLAERVPEVEDGGPAFPRYEEDEPRYLGLWRDWWKRTRPHAGDRGL
jgi:hypothetical protein